ncbi:TonB-dependent hemoglobin/transferrin/lactoferrin family receptor [Marinobacterium iners]|uniref:Hemoglobin/transferrin/lactoferrin receptor protein n=2 Tax=Gammaproteobacteria TaxID=1236 RepID=A0A1H3Y377_9GAMM|nr:TonB-dependent hemoglobin/transferrin/lactoferrin family receptor [Marinobacterium iners]SEA05531.1 hemoglobin/transferrin/lactoferrin receptor protein [Marinobacterium iners DSM 11526]
MHTLDRSRPVHMLQRGIVLAISAVLSSTCAAAETKTPKSEPVYELNELTIRATRLGESVVSSRRSVGVIDTDEMEQRQPQSVPDALRAVPNVSVAGGSRPLNQTVNIRGLSGSRVLQTVDGVRQDFSSGHRPDYLLPPELISRVEVLKGPVSSLWGSGAIGGVVAQETLSADDLLEGDENFGGLIKTGHNSNSDLQASVAALAGREGSASWMLGGFYRDGNNLEHGDNSSLEGSEILDRGGIAKLDWKVDQDQALDLSYVEVKTAGQVPSNGAAVSNASSNFMIDRDTRSRNLRLGYHLDTASPLLNANLMVWRNQVEMEESRLSDGRQDSTQMDAYGFTLNNLTSLGQMQFLYGIDAGREEFSGQRSGNGRPVPPDAESDKLGAFLQADIALNEHWSARLGGRYDHFETDAEGLGSRSDSAFSPSAALTWSPVIWGSLSLRHERAFRAPSSEEMYTTGTHFCMGPGFCNTFASNPDLDAEKAANTELVANAHWAELLGGDNLELQMAVFENEVDDFIEQIVVGPSFFPVMDPGYTTWVNVDKARLRGFEVSAAYKLQNLKIKLGYGLTRGKDLQTGEDLTNIPADTFTADISHGFWNEQLLAGVRLEHARAQNRTGYEENTSGIRYDGYTLTDLYLSYTPKAIPGLDLNLTVNNLTDKHYRRAWESLDEAGRELILSTTYRF